MNEAKLIEKLRAKVALLQERHAQACRLADDTYNARLTALLEPYADHIRQAAGRGGDSNG